MATNRAEVTYDGSGRAIIDARQDAEIVVTAKHVAGAQQCDQGSCAFAEAVKLQYPNVEAVKVGLTITRICFPDMVLRYRNSAAMVEQIRSFDETGKFKSGTYKMLAPPVSKRIGSNNGGPKPGASRGGGRKATTIEANSPRRPSLWTFNNVPNRKTKARAK